ncbi:protein TALPID3 isoform X2 [Sceloporus undulatus]|uniref:protein TALPID3 isoform X2 n=1 Tax=Sceloporus undulatus TaxID=8520 RepID=UPI001C4D9F7E|nr:protein TALPID3 isoform X2 [Sceloporus undulatus]
MKKKPLDTQAAASADSKPAACAKKKVSISAKRLREIAPPRRLERPALTKDEGAYVPPALVANKPEPRKLTTETSEDEAEGDPSKYFARGSEQLPFPGKDGQDSQATPEAYCPENTVHVPSEMKEAAAKQKAADIFVSHYDAGQKEAVRAVFKQRIQNAPVFKEVKVQLLDNTWPDKKDNPKSTCSEMDSATTIAAATAAAIASTAPLLKVQSDLEAKVSSVSEILNKLQETDRQLQHVAEQQATVKAQQSNKSPCHQRVGELEKQMNLFMEQRIQHLENLQQQQMNIQSQLISSALNSGGFQAASTAPSKETTKNAAKPGRSLATQTSTQQDLFSACAVHTQACSRHFGNHNVHRQKSPLNTPAPRRYAPVPVSRDAKISQKMSKREQPVGEKENVHQSAYGRTLGGGKLLEQILNSQETPLRQDPMKSNTVLWPFERECRSNVQQPEPIHAFKSTDQNSNPIERTVKKADDVLRDLGQLKREMHDILQDAKDWKSDMNRIMKTTPNLGEAVQVKDHLQQPQSSHSLWPSSEALIPMPPPAEQKDPVAPTLLELQQLSKSSILQSTKASKSILRDAEKILRAVQKNKKLLEENLEAIIRAKDGNALHAFIDELTADRDVLEEIRIRKTVDEWIKTISMEIQDEMGRTDCLKRQQATKMTKASREMNGKSQYPPRIPTKRPVPATRPIQKLTDMGFLKTRMGLPHEEFLSQVYGRPIYQGHRSTLKKSPYLRFNSPPPKSKPPRPKLIESVKGTKVKSARTQTNYSVHSKVASPERPHLASAPHQELQYLFSPNKEAPSTSGPLEGHLIPMAIPLGQKQINGISPQPSGISIGEFHPVTVTTSVPPPPPNLQKPQLNVKKPNIAVIHMKSEKKDPPKLTLQVLPNVDIDSIFSDRSSVSQDSLTSFPTKGMIQASPDGSQLHDEELKLPGAHFDVTDVSQDEEDEDIDIPEFVEPVLEFNRRGERESPKYNGPPFPPAAPPPPQVSSDVLDEIIEKQETLENKLVDWVEQEVMARIINGMYPTQKEAVPNINSSESEHSLSVSSDIVEAAGTAGFQLFVDAGIPVDSEMIRRFVNEALAETVATMLGDRETHKATSVPVIPPTVLPEKETALSTPLVTPEATPPQSPPPLNEPFPVKTPESSLSVTEMDGNAGEQPLRTGAGLEAAVASLVHTPVVTPVTTPPKVVTPSPPVSEHVPDMEAKGKPAPPNPWEDAELPLEEEKPSPQSEEGAYHPRAVIMSVAKHEEPDNLVLPASVLTEPHDLQSQEPRAQSPSLHTPSSGSSTEESSPTTTETETVDRPISEGELLCSYGQLLAAKALAEGGLSLPNLSDSLTNSLHDAQEMDYDPPSEGQVLRRPHKGYHRDLALSLFSKLNQAPLASQEEICGSENTDDSAGELSEGQRPRLTRTAETILMGQSVYMDRPASQAPRQPNHHKPSPGQHGREAGEVLEDADVTHGPMSMAELDQPVSPTAYGDSRLASHLDSTSLQKHQETQQPMKSRVIFVKPRSESTEQQDFPGNTNHAQFEPSGYFASLLPVAETAPHLSKLPEPAKMSVMVPSVNIDDELQSFSSIHGSSDSSGADTL